MLLPLHRTSPSTQPSQNRTIPCPSPPPSPFNERSACFAFVLSLSLFVGRASVCACMVSHPHYPLPRTKLASLVKGEVLSPEKIRATTGGIALHPPASPSPQPSQKDNNPSPRTITLASLVKGRWIDGKAQALILLLSVCDTPAFFYLSNFSAVKTEGLLYTHQPLHPRNHRKKTIIPRPAPCPCLPCQREVLSLEKNRTTTGGIATTAPRHAPTHPKPHYPTLFS